MRLLHRHISIKNMSDNGKVAKPSLEEAKQFGEY